MAINGVNSAGTSYYDKTYGTTKAAADNSDSSDSASKTSNSSNKITKENVNEAISAANASNSSYINSMFGSGSKTAATGTLDSIYSSLNNMSLIRSGAYGKLLKAYYASQNGSANTETQAAAVKTARVSASELKSASNALSNSSLFKADANGEYDREGILSAAKDFVSAYNDTLSDISSVDKVSILQKGVSMVGMTDAMSGMLNKIGITVGEDNSLSINEATFNKADISDLKAIFEGNNSYASRIGQKAAMINGNAVDDSRATYTNKGTYANANLDGTVVDTET